MRYDELFESNDSDHEELPEHVASTAEGGSEGGAEPSQAVDLAVDHPAGLPHLVNPEPLKMLRPAPPVMSSAEHAAWAAALQPGAALDLSFDGAAPCHPSPLPPPPPTSPHHPSLPPTPHHPSLPPTSTHTPTPHRASGGFWDVELVRADGAAQTLGPPLYSVRALQFDAEHSVGGEQLRPAHVWDAARREWTSRPPPGVHVPATPKAKVCHTGLEPKTSRPQTGLLLTRASLALDRSGPAPRPTHR